MQEHVIGYDRGEMFYCRNCGIWCKIKFSADDVGIAGFIAVSIKTSESQHDSLKSPLFSTC